MLQCAHQVPCQRLTHLEEWKEHSKAWVWDLSYLFISRQSLPDAKSMLAGGQWLPACHGDGLSPGAGSGPGGDSQHIPS